MKILIVLPTLGGGGAERLHVNLANYWITKDIKVDFILLKSYGEFGSLIPLLSPQINVIHLNNTRIRDCFFPLFKIFRKSNHNIILTAMWPLTAIVFFSWFISGRKGKLYLSEHESLSLAYASKGKLYFALLKTIIFLTYPKSNGVIVVSEGLKKDICEIAKLPNKLVKVIYNPVAHVQLSISSKQILQKPCWKPNSLYNILSVGRLTIEKDHSTLIKAFSLIPKEINANLVILGEGPLRPFLQDLINELKLSQVVFMPGYQIDPTLWYKSAHLFVLSSLREGFGNVIVEALEQGVPVVSTNCPSGPAEILKNGRYGKLVPLNDTLALSKAILESLSESHFHEDLKSRAKDFTVQKISDQYLEFFYNN